MMFDEAKLRINSPRTTGSGIEYDGTNVGQILKLVHILHASGDSYNVEYRELLPKGNVAIRQGLASYQWILKQAFSPGVELISIKPSEQTLSRWTAIDGWK